MAKKLNNEYAKIKSGHVKSALQYIALEGKWGKHHILHIDAPARLRALKYKGKYFSIKEVVRAAFLFHYDGEILSDVSSIIKRVKKVVKQDELRMRLTTNIGIEILKKTKMFQKGDFVRFDENGKETVIVAGIKYDDDASDDE